MFAIFTILLAGGLLFGVSLFAPHPTWAQTGVSGTGSPAAITVDRDGSLFTIIPTYTLPDTASADTTELRYELTVERTGASTSRSRQAGSFTPAPGRTDTLSTVRVNAQPGDHLHLHLVVRRGDEIVGSVARRDTVEAPSGE